jgi:hypothetical protein
MMSYHDQTRPPVRQFVCAVCGEPAPTRKQWWNRDTGFGCCPRCFQRTVERFGMEEAVDLYGRPGVHHSIPPDPTPEAVEWSEQYSAAIQRAARERD